MVGGSGSVAVAVPLGVAVVVVVAVGFAVAGGAEEDEVVDVGGAAVFPGEDVVDVAGLGGEAAVDAGLVPRVQGEALGLVGGSLGATQVEGLAVGAEDGRDDVGVTGQSAEFFDLDGGPVDEFGVWSTP